MQIPHPSESSPSTTDKAHEDKRTDKIAEALVKVQSEIKHAKIDGEAHVPTKTGGKFSYEYSTLGSVWEACRESLGRNGIAVVQAPDIVSGQPTLRTSLLHTSGQRIDSLCPLLNSKGDMQGLGSAITYARRYSLAAMVGVVQEDDDAQGAVAPLQHRNTGTTNANATRTISPAQATRLYTIASKELGLTNQEAKVVLDGLGYSSSKNILVKDYDSVIKALRQSTTPSNDKSWPEDL